MVRYGVRFPPACPNLPIHADSVAPSRGSRILSQSYEASAAYNWECSTVDLIYHELDPQNNLIAAAQRLGKQESSVFPFPLIWKRIFGFF
jgi:hypothetical protein